MYVVFCFLVFGCRYHCSQLSGNIRLRNDPLCVKWCIKPHTLTHCDFVNYNFNVTFLLPDLTTFCWYLWMGVAEGHCGQCHLFIQHKHSVFVVVLVRSATVCFAFVTVSHNAVYCISYSMSVHSSHAGIMSKRMNVVWCCLLS